MNKYEKVAQWILDECDEPLDEIAWLLEKLHSNTAKKPQHGTLSLDFNEAYGDVLEILKDRKTNG